MQFEIFGESSVQFPLKCWADLMLSENFKAPPPPHLISDLSYFFAIASCIPKDIEVKHIIGQFIQLRADRQFQIKFPSAYYWVSLNSVIHSFNLF